MASAEMVNWTGQPISTAGIYVGVPFDAYHSNLCDGASVSASTLSLLYGTCPARAWAHHYLNPDQPEREDTDALVFGQAAHCFVVEGQKVFDQRWGVKPKGLNLSTKEGRLWKAAHAGQDYVSHDDHEAIQGMREQLLKHPHARRAFLQGAPEVSCAVKDAETGLWLKTRPDYLRQGIALDYKTTRTGSRELWRKQAASLRYHVSAAYCIDIMAQLGWDLSYAFVVQEKSKPYLVAVRVLSEEFLHVGRQIYRNALRRFADCYSSGNWPGYPDIETVEIPPWELRELENV